MTADTTTEITEVDWKTLATTEITHLTDEEKDYLPRAWDEWIARVRREAKAEAWERGHVCGYSDAQDTARSITHGPHNPYTKTGGPR